jgi:hypothetical protein
MCTVSIIPVDGGWRVVCNRDEHRERNRALAPRWHALSGGRRAVWPIDTHAGGTWIAGSEHGLVLCVLNLNPHPPLSVVDIPDLRSRGLLIPGLIGLDSAGQVAAAVARGELGRYAPFRLLAMDADSGNVAELRWDRHELVRSWHAADSQCFVSSGLGDARVAPRLELFDSMVRLPGPTRRGQDEFHRHQWPRHPEVSVLMSRAEARTVSITTLEVQTKVKVSRIRMAYKPVTEGVMAVR